MQENETKKIAVKARNIIKDFNSGGVVTPVLHGINLDIAYGKLTMIVGPSGCGKTTLISILTGILSATSGEVFINDTSLNKLTDGEKVLFRRKKMGFIFQQYNLLPALTAAENAAIPLIADGIKIDEAVKEAGKILEAIDMGKHLDKLPNQLSGGQQQRVAIARALVHKPELIVCDEPTAALDAATGYKVMEILKDNALKMGGAVIVVTHDNRIFNFADEIISMEDGRVVAGDPSLDLK
jgi:putative ABC transport system ATP-binding protein